MLSLLTLRRAVTSLLEHFEQDSGTFVADPDKGLIDSRDAVVDACSFEAREGREKWTTLRRSYAERREFWHVGFCPSLNALQDVLNRHWSFHARQKSREADGSLPR